MKKKLIAALLIVVSLLALCACGETAREAVVPEPRSGSRVPYVDTNKSSFDLSMASMRYTPDSTCFSEVGYCDDLEILVVTFRDSGATYVYLDFPEVEWDNFIDADSLGSYYNAYIKGEYTCYRYD